MLVQRARDYLPRWSFCNLVGGQDELVFDGHSLVIDHDGTRRGARRTSSSEELLVADLDPEGVAAPRACATRATDRPRGACWPRSTLAGRAAAARRGRARGRRRRRRARLPEPLDRDAEVYAALALGLRDYVDKNGFGHVVLGLSGGIDSALVACLAVDALGAERVQRDDHALARTRPTETQERRARAGRATSASSSIELPIGPTRWRPTTASLAGAFDGREPDITEENLQARIRGNLLMALSNKFGWLVLTTGNKSELSVGYSTLYGDMAGGFAVIKDVPKTLVYELARYRNERGERAGVPPSIIDRAPSAELRPDQRDEDSLPPYDVLDPILEAYVEEDIGPRAARSPHGLRPRGRRPRDPAGRPRRVQAPPGAARHQDHHARFGRDRRMPITNRYGAERAARRHRNRRVLPVGYPTDGGQGQP